MRLKISHLIIFWEIILAITEAVPHFKKNNDLKRKIVVQFNSTLVTSIFYAFEIKK